MKYKIVTLILFLVIFLKPASVFYTYKDVYLKPNYKENYTTYKRIYENSQYANKNSKGFINDDILELYAAGAFLYGLNPILIVHDQPPLGRYLMAGTILLFDNAYITILFCLILSIVGLYLIARRILKKTLLALIPLGIFMNEPLFFDKFRYAPLLEPIQLPFIIFSIYFFIKGIDSKTPLKWFFLNACMIGCVVSIRFFILGVFLVFSQIVVFIFNYLEQKKNRKKIIESFKIFCYTLPISILILVLSYTRTIVLGAPIWHIFGIQRYILEYHKSKFTELFTFWDLLFFNRWHTWWGDHAISSDSNWNVMWPISFISTVALIIGRIFKILKLSIDEMVLISWIFSYCVMLSAGYSSTRYFLPLVPFLYILLCSFSKKIYERIKQ